VRVLRRLSGRWSRAAGVRAVDDGRASDVRVCEGESVFAGYRARVRGGRRLPGDRGKSGPGAFDDRGVPQASRGGAGGAVRRRALVVQAGRTGEGWGDRDRWDQDARERLAALESRL